MRKVFILLFLTIIANSAVLEAQNPNRPNTIIGKRLWIDHHTPSNDEFASFDELTGGFEVAYLRNLNPNLNAVIPLKVGILQMPDEQENHTFIGFDFLTQLQHYKEESYIIPYGFAGIGTVLEDFETVSFQIPLGAGLNVRLGKYAFINFQAEYRVALSEDRDNIQYGLGISFMLGKIDDETLPPPLLDTPLSDLDQDGIPDAEDDCPDKAGVIAMKGCPDTDNDGLSDKEDECPELAGSIESGGCPDSDGDGLTDNVDKCPNEPGPKSNEGCPPGDADNDGFADDVDQCPKLAGKIRGCPDSDGDGIEDAKDDCPFAAGEGRFNGCPDTDKDGIIDSKDKCPNSAAPNSPDGCPTIKEADKEILDYALQAVQFEFGSDVLKMESYPALDQVIGVLNNYLEFRLEIIGHTDNVGSDNRNLLLSQKRSKSCYDYLISKNVSPSRMGYGGFGENNPITSNKTDEGRALNRRVEFILTPM